MKSSVKKQQKKSNAVITDRTSSVRSTRRCLRSQENQFFKQDHNCAKQTKGTKTDKNLLKKEKQRRVSFTNKENVNNFNSVDAVIKKSQKTRRPLQKVKNIGNSTTKKKIKMDNKNIPGDVKTNPIPDVADENNDKSNKQDRTDEPLKQPPVNSYADYITKPCHIVLQKLCKNENKFSVDSDHNKGIKVKSSHSSSGANRQNKCSNLNVNQMLNQHGNSLNKVKNKLLKKDKCTLKNLKSSETDSRVKRTFAETNKNKKCVEIIDSSKQIPDFFKKADQNKSNPTELQNCNTNDPVVNKNHSAIFSATTEVYDNFAVIDNSLLGKSVLHLEDPEDFSVDLVNLKPCFTSTPDHKQRTGQNEHCNDGNISGDNNNFSLYESPQKISPVKNSLPPQSPSSDVSTDSERDWFVESSKRKALSPLLENVKKPRRSYVQPIHVRKFLFKEQYGANYGKKVQKKDFAEEKFDQWVQSMSRHFEDIEKTQLCYE